MTSRKLNLSADVADPIDQDPHRPELRLAAHEAENGDPACVSVCIGAAWGQQTRFLSLSPDEARTMARYLAEMALAAEMLAVVS